jgi:anti-sigma factor (TIGR02949 family)
MDQWACRSVQAKLDYYIDNELLTETNLELSEHLDSCAACANEAEARRTVRTKLQLAIRHTPVPPGLEARVRARLRCLLVRSRA